LDALTEQSAHELRNAAPAMAPSHPMKRRFIRAAQSAIRVHPCQKITGRSYATRSRSNWIDAVSDALGIDNTDERGWRLAPHGWVVMRASLDPELDGLTERIIGAGFAVSNGLGHGFLEAVYRNALVEELRLSGLAVQAENS
jgi:hypothetical protein